MDSHLMSTIGFVFIFSLLISPTISLGPPVWPERFTQDYMQGNYNGDYFPGKIWYDYANRRQRVDVKHILLDFQCYYVGKTQNTTCSRIYINQTLYIRLPDLNLCCKCCKQKIGINCGLYQPDWLNRFVYVGQDNLNGTIYNHWTADNGCTSYYATVGQKQIPRRNQDLSQYTDYLVSSFTDAAIDDKIFNLPVQCQKNCPNKYFCPGDNQQQNQESQQSVQIVQNQNLIKEKIEKQDYLQK